jgi:AraC-like DNA-binding protein
MRKWERLFRKTIEHTPPEEEPRFIKAFGLTPEQAADPVGTMLDAGVELLYATSSLIRYRECVRIEALAQQREEEEEEERDSSDEMCDKWIARRDEFRPVFCGRMWREISGMSEDAEDSSTPGERAEQIGKLLNAVEKLARYELNAHAAKRAAGEKDARTYLWDPLASICKYLAISQRKLTTLSKEYTGMAAHELVDRIRAERVKDKMRADLRPFVANFLSTQRHEDTKTPRTEENDGKPAKSALRSTNPQSPISNPQLASAVWYALKVSRQSPEFHRATWAMSHGFANYQRFYRACLLYYGLTPGQLELEVIRELLDEYKKQETEVKSDGAVSNTNTENRSTISEDRSTPAGPPDPK